MVLLALSIALQRDIYCYLPFRLTELTACQRNDPDALKALFDRHGLSNHLLYRVMPNMQSNSYNTQSPICIFMMVSITTQQLNRFQTILFYFQLMLNCYVLINV